MPAWKRLPLKWLIFGVVTLGVLFPDPRLLVRNLGRYRNLDALIDGQNPHIRDWVPQFERFCAATTRPAAGGVDMGRAGPTTRAAKWGLREVEAFVYRKVAYAWDWDQWGAADYIPTVSEVFSAADARPNHELQEDCDGRAVLAASLLAALGEKSRIVTDLRHVWVETDRGGLMGPGAKPTLSSAPGGTRTAPLTALRNLPVGLSYGVAVFPLGREVVLWAAAVALSLHRRVKRMTCLLGALLALQGLLFVRTGVIVAPHGWLEQAWPAWVGLGHAGAGLGLLWWASSRARRTTGPGRAAVAAGGTT
ncbi:MAG: hypothetical protein U1A27_06390 [Phycisphaerae bacterium]